MLKTNSSGHNKIGVYCSECPPWLWAWL